MTPPFRVDLIVGARPNFVKIAPIVRALRAKGTFAPRLIHTGQHYDFLMDRVFFEELRIPAPDVNLKIGSGPASEQVAKIMLALHPLFVADRPHLLVVVGDVNSTVAAALTASYLRIPIAHVEAGLRSFDREMPEELNRLVVDQLSDLHFVTEKEGQANLIAERVAPERIKFVGNVMIDTAYDALERAIPAPDTFAALGASPAFRERAANGFGFATLHRPSNVDDPVKLKGLIEALAKVSQKLPLVFAVHPRTRGNIEKAGLAETLNAPGLFACEPLAYLASLGLMRDAKVVVTDSGGMQEETTALGVPCITVRDNTERPITIEEGTNTLIGADPARIGPIVDDILRTGGKSGRKPALWDGKAAERIAVEAEAFLRARN
ncbi:MAG: UDP-N-acetylglucosamine 2-epimerase (non-hydrolyzing) [Pseudomonadota bacterium]|nr:UDP-N-acetylglucosamine 2-epimerase (non-hydrolyzing) [Pseudomonadota bacterium]